MDRRWRGGGWAIVAGVTAVLALAWGRAGATTVRWGAQSDWLAWQYARGTLEITPAGLVRPRYYRKDVNACLDAAEFTWTDNGQEHRGGVRNVGSAANTADGLIDGDDTTAWGPQRADGPEQWWVEIDLGRMVTASRLVLRFDPGGDPFEEFKVYMSDGMPAFVSAAVAEAPDYRVVASQTKPNQEMVLEYQLHDVVNAVVPHRSVRFVYVQLTAWRDPETRPRLAEVQVIALGDNLVLGSQERGGDIAAYSAGGVAATLIDGDGVSYWDSSRGGTFPEAHWYFHLNLGARFWIDTIVLVAHSPGILGRGVTPPVHHRIEVSDGRAQPVLAQAWEAKGPYVWTQVDNVAQNPPPGMDEPLYVLDSTFEPRQVERIFYDHLTPHGVNAGQIRIREIQAYGEGFIPRATLRSEFVDLGASSAVTGVRWAADTPDGAGVEVRTRSGDQIIQETKYYTADGQEVRDRNNDGSTKDDYDKLPPFRRGAVETLVRPGGGWSNWSRPYLVSGSRFLSPSPRRYVQFEVALTSDIQHAAATLDWLELTYGPPLARTVVGEIWPATSTAAAQAQDLTCYIRPTFETRNRGFDEITIATPSPAEFVGLRVGGVEVAPVAVRTGPDSLWVRLPLVRYQADPLVAVDFRCTVFLNNTPFETFLGLGALPGSQQQVDPGDATPDVASERLVVGLPVQDELLEWEAAAPLVFSPNDDGVNDQLEFRFVVHKINSPRALGVRVYSLRGGLVCELQQQGTSGRYSLVWDGRDTHGQRVSPGLYIAEVFVASAQRQAVMRRVVAAAY